jgi:phosphatidylserine/phosphatidylglycerophosphate/cardiolipin synthase-like enzyme
MKLKIPFLLRSWIVRILVIAVVIVLGWIIVRSLIKVGAIPSATDQIQQTTPNLDKRQQVFFMQAPGQGCATRKQPVVQALLQDLASAQKQVHIAMYSFTIDEVADALVHAKECGIPVDLVMESDNMDSTAVKQLITAGISIRGDEVDSLMHDKFLVIDDRIVWTGSMNMTYTSLCEDLNNMVRIVDPYLAEKYDAEFSEMFDQGLFGWESPVDPQVMPAVIDSCSLGVYFSPEDHVQQQILDMIGIAQSSIEFLGYSFTSDPIADALIEKSGQGVKVRGIMDAVSAASNIGTEYDTFRQAGLDVRLASTIGVMHHKVFIIDGQLVMLGSYNFTRSAEEDNDENLLILHNPDIAREFQVEFERIYSTAKP